MGETAKRVASPLPADQIPDEAFKVCAQNEALVTGETGSAPRTGAQPSRGLEELKGILRPRIIEEVGKVRNILETPAEPQ